MNATISQLWETRREILTYEDNEFERPQSFSDLKKCDNVVIGDQIGETKMREILVDDRIILVESNKVRHPMGGTMYILEVQQ